MTRVEEIALCDDRQEHCGLQRENAAEGDDAEGKKGRGVGEEADAP